MGPLSLFLRTEGQDGKRPPMGADVGVGGWFSGELSIASRRVESGLVLLRGEKIFEGCFELGILELKTGLLEARGDDAATFEDEFRLGAEEEGAKTQHGGGGGESDRNAEGLLEEMHHVGVAERAGGSEIEDAAEIGALEEEEDSAAEILFMDPGNPLGAGSHSAAEAKAREAGEDGEDGMRAAAEDDGGAEGDFARARGRGRGEDRVFPGLGDVDGEGVVGFGRGTDVTVEFVVRAIGGVLVDGGGAGVEPDLGRGFALGDYFSEELGRAGAAFEDLFLVPPGVAAIDAPAGEVDDGECRFEFANPRARRVGVPLKIAGGSLEGGTATEDQDVIVPVEEEFREPGSECAGAAGDDNLWTRCHAIPSFLLQQKLL